MAVQDNYSVGRITGRVELSRAKTLIAKLPELEAGIARDFPTAELRIQLTGTVVLVRHMEIYLIDSQFRPSETVRAVFESIGGNPTHLQSQINRLYLFLA